MRCTQYKNKVQNWPKDNPSLTGGSFKVNGYFREDGRMRELILYFSSRTIFISNDAYGWPSYSQLIIFTSSKNIFTSSKNIFTGSRNKTLAKATHN